MRARRHSPTRGKSFRKPPHNATQWLWQERSLEAAIGATDHLRSRIEALQRK
jgi:hypothetical protein